MDKEINNREHEHAPGLIYKAASLGAQEVTESELHAINKLAMSPLTADDVFTFKAVLCDNEIDRSFERFSLKALDDLRKLYVGKTVIKDHSWRSDNQVARVYSTELVQHPEKTTKAGEVYTELVAHCYMVKTASNADLIAEIKGGIKKEGSVGCSVSSCYCSICGTDNSKTYCPHWPGKSYDKANGKETCTFLLDGGKDAYEFSLVAVPAQKAAGVSKSYTGETVYPEIENEVETPAPEVKKTETADEASELAIKARLMAAKAHTILRGEKEDE